MPNTTVRSALMASAFALLVAIPRQQLAAQQTAIPTPESVLGFPVGADFKLATYDESIGYFQRLAAVSDRIRLLDVGTTSTGHPWTLAIISSTSRSSRSSP